MAAVCNHARDTREPCEICPPGTLGAAAVTVLEPAVHVAPPSAPAAELVTPLAAPPLVSNNPVKFKNAIADGSPPAGLPDLAGLRRRVLAMLPKLAESEAQLRTAILLFALYLNSGGTDTGMNHWLGFSRGFIMRRLKTGRGADRILDSNNRPLMDYGHPQHGAIDLWLDVKIAEGLLGEDAP